MALGGNPIFNGKNFRGATQAPPVPQAQYGQNPYGQAYIAAYVINQVHQGCKKKSGAPYFIDSGTLLISPDKTTSYKDDFKTLTKSIVSGFKDKYLSC